MLRRLQLLRAHLLANWTIADQWRYFPAINGIPCLLLATHPEFPNETICGLVKDSPTPTFNDFCKFLGDSPLTILTTGYRTGVLEALDRAIARAEEMEIKESEIAQPVEAAV